MSKELETLRAELHKEVDAKIDKLIKPEFKTIFWYKYKHREIYHQDALIISNDLDEYSYGIDLAGKWTVKFSPINELNSDRLIEATPTEVQEALEKEAVKRYNGVKRITSLDNSCIETEVATDFKVCFNHDTNKLWCKSKSGYNICLMDNNGTWAEIVKPMSLDEIASDFDNGYGRSVFNIEAFFRQYLTENKSQIIETLNNL